MVEESFYFIHIIFIWKLNLIIELKEAAIAAV